MHLHFLSCSNQIIVPPLPPAILPVSSSRANSAWLPCGCRNKDQDDSRLTEAPHGVLSTQLCGGQRKGVSQSEGRGRGRDRWQHRMSRAPDRELQWGEEKRGYESLAFKWAPTSPTNTQLPLAGQGHVIKRDKILQRGKKFKCRCIFSLNVIT